MNAIESILQFFHLDNFVGTIQEVFNPSNFFQVIDQIRTAPPINIIIVTVIPLIFMYVVIKSNKGQKQPKKWLAFAILSGFITVSFAYVLNVFASDVLRWARLDFSSNKLFLNFDAMYGVALVEEAIKLLILFILIRKNKFAHSPYTGILYGALVGLSFAMIENLLSIYINLLNDGYGKILVRCLTAGAMHVSVGVLMGYFLSISDISKNDSDKRLWDYKAIFIPPIIHGTYNGIATNIGAVQMFYPKLSLIFILLFLFSIIAIYMLIIKIFNKGRILENAYYSKTPYPENYDLYTYNDLYTNKILDGQEYFENRQFINK